MGGSKGGGSNVNVEPSPYEGAMANIATGLYNDTAGLRAGFLRDYGQLLGVQNAPDSGGGIPGKGTGGQNYTLGTPNYDITKLPTYEPLFGLQKQSLESQYQQAKKNIMATTPGGGNLTGALTGLEANRASTMGAMPAQLSSGILGDMLNKAYGAAWQTPTTTVAGLGSAASSYANRQGATMAANAAESAGKDSLMGGIGSGLGSLGKAAILK